MMVRCVSDAGRPAAQAIGRRQCLRTAALPVASLAGAGVQAQSVPLRMRVGCPAGSTVDIGAPLLAETLRAAKPDGHTVSLVAHGHMTLFSLLDTDLRCDPVRCARNSRPWAFLLSPAARRPWSNGSARNRRSGPPWCAPRVLRPAAEPSSATP